jgi:hypothetical protein
MKATCTSLWDTQPLETPCAETPQGHPAHHVTAEVDWPAVKDLAHSTAQHSSSSGGCLGLLLLLWGGQLGQE